MKISQTRAQRTGKPPKLGVGHVKPLAVRGPLIVIGLATQRTQLIAR